MTPRATCTDCRWTFESDNHESVSDALERHARKEQHHVNFQHSSAASV